MLFLQTFPGMKTDSTTINNLGAFVDTAGERGDTLTSLVKSRNWGGLVDIAIHDIWNLGKSLLVVILIFFVGRWIIRQIIKLMDRLFEKSHVDISLRSFLISIVKAILYFILITVIINHLGIQTTSIIALVGAAGFAIGMALSGTLQNFAGGVMVLLLKPYRVGDYIEAQGQAGTVKEIQLFNTVLNTPDNKTIYVPNGSISTGIINNYSREKTRRVEWIFGINYGDDFALAQKIIKDILDADKRILREQGYTIEINTLADSSVNVVVRAWVNTSEFWGVYFDINSQVYKILPEKGLHFPYPQMDIHITE